jgi:hypothetical protein
MLNIPERLAAACRSAPARRAWLDLLPRAIGELQDMIGTRVNGRRQVGS